MLCSLTESGVVCCVVWCRDRLDGSNVYREVLCSLTESGVVWCVVWCRDRLDGSNVYREVLCSLTESGVVWCVVTGWMVGCVQEAQLSGRRDSSEMSIVISNMLIDPMYLDMLLYVFKTAHHASVAHAMHTYMWVDASFGDSSAHAVHQGAILLALGGNMVSKIRASYQCGIEIVSSIEVLAYNRTTGQVVVSNSVKTDQYNISKLQSFLHASVKRHSVYALDVLIAPQRISLRKSRGWWDPGRVQAAVEQCFGPPEPPLQGALGAQRGPVWVAELLPRQWEMINYTNFETFDSGVKIDIAGLFCPNTTELECVLRHIGALKRDSRILCVAEVNVLHTKSADAAAGLYTNGGLVGAHLADFQQIEPDMLLTHKEPVCRDIMHIWHSATATNYADAVHATQVLFAMETVYTQHLLDRIIVQTGIHTTSTYRIHLQSTSVGNMVRQQQQQGLVYDNIDNNDYYRRLQQTLKNRYNSATQSVHIRHIWKQAALRETDVRYSNTSCLQILTHIAPSRDALILAISGALVTHTSLVAVLAHIVKIARPAPLPRAVQQVVYRIAGPVQFEHLAVQEAVHTMQHYFAHQFDLYNSTESLVFRMRTTQRFTIQPSWLSRFDVIGIPRAFDPAADFWVSSSYVLRVLVTFPVDVSTFDAFVIKLVQDIIFKVNDSNSVHVVSVSEVEQYGGSNASASSASATSYYTVVEFHMPHTQMHHCDLTKHSNVADYDVELANIVALLLGTTEEINIQSSCVVTNSFESLLVVPNNATDIVCTYANNTQTHFLQQQVTSPELQASLSESCDLETSLSIQSTLQSTWPTPTPGGQDNNNTGVDGGQDNNNTGVDGSQAVLQRALQLWAAVQASVPFANLDAVCFYTLATYSWPQYQAPGYEALLELVQVFEIVYTVPTVRDSMANKSVFSTRNHGMSASEKEACHAPLLAQSTLHTQQAALSQNCAAKTSVLWQNTTCMVVIAHNTRINKLLLQQFIASSTSFAMLQANTAITFQHSLVGYIDPFPCNPEAVASIQMLLSGREDTTHFNVQHVNLTKLHIAYQATPPFRHTTAVPAAPEHNSSSHRFAQLLHLVQGLTPQHIVFRSGQQENVVTLHMYTRGVPYSMAQGMFQPFLYQYLANTVGVGFSSMQILNITAIHTYALEFPSNLFYEADTHAEAWPDQLYIKAVVSGLQHCADMQQLIDLGDIQHTYGGVEMFVRLLDNQDVGTVCATVSHIEYSTHSCTAGDIRHASLPGTSIWGAIILELDVLCEAPLSSPLAESCSAHLASSDDALFFQSLRVIALRVPAVDFYFLQDIRICGLDARTLSHALTEKAEQEFASMSNAKCGGNAVHNTSKTCNGHPLACGNGVLDNNEQCDDANLDDTDGCRACQIDTLFTCLGAWRHPTAPHDLGYLVSLI